MKTQRTVKGWGPMMGDHEHLTTMFGGEEVFEYESHDLLRASETLRRYAMGRSLVDLEERIERLEKALGLEGAA